RHRARAESPCEVAAEPIEAPAGVARVLATPLQKRDRHVEERGDGGRPDDAAQQRHAESGNLEDGEARNHTCPHRRRFTYRTLHGGHPTVTQSTRPRTRVWYNRRRP